MSLGSCRPLATLAMQGQESTLTGLVNLMVSRGVSMRDWPKGSRYVEAACNNELIMVDPG